MSRRVDNLFRPYWANVAGNEFQQPQEMGLSEALQQELLHAGGEQFPSFAATTSQRLSVGIRTTNLETFFSAIGFTGLAIAASPNDFVGRWRANTQHGGPGTGGEKLTCLSGLAVPGRVEAAQGQIATAEFDVVGDFDGTNDPFVPAAEGTLVAPTTGVTDEVFTMGPVKFGGAFIPGLKRVSLPFNAQLDEEAAGGDIHNSFTSIQTMQPRFELDTTEWAIRTYGIRGTLQAGTTEVYFRAKDRDDNQADAALAHIKLTIVQSTLRVGQIRGPFPGSVTTGLILQPEDDGVNFVTVALNQAIA